MKSQRNVTECRVCDKYKNHDCEENLIRKHRKVGREVSKNPHVISGECEGFVSKNKPAEPTDASPEPAEETVEENDCDHLDCSFGIVFFADSALEVQEAVDILLEVEYEPSKVKIHIVSDKSDPEQKMVSLDRLQHKFKASRLTMNVVDQEILQLETHAFNAVFDTDWFILLRGCDVISSDFLSEVNRKHLEKKEKKTIYRDENTDAKAILAAQAKSEYLLWADFDLMVESLEEGTLAEDNEE